MKRVTIVCWIFAVSAVLASANVGAAESRNPEPDGGRSADREAGRLVVGAQGPAAALGREKRTPATIPPVYKPPPRGAPVGRIAGGTRGGSADVPALCVLTPDDRGRTTQEQPSLYWFLSEPTRHPVVLTIVDDRSVTPLVEGRLPEPERPGVQRIRLADWGARLAPGVVYRWHVSIVPDPERRSRDLVAWGEIQRVVPLEALGEQLRRSGPAQAPSVYAEAGLWYDALDAVGKLIDGSVDPTPYVRQRAALLEQVGLSEIATSDVAGR